MNLVRGFRMPAKRQISQFVGQYQEWKPAEPLRPHVCCVWMNDLSRASARDYHVVPDGCVDIVWTGEHACVAGPDTRPIHEQVRSRGLILGVRFHPGAALPWFGVPLSEILNDRVPLEDFWGAEARRLEDRVLGAAGPGDSLEAMQRTLLSQLGRIGPPDPRIAFLRLSASAAHVESGRGRMRPLSEKIGISERSLRRRCDEAFGYGFKTLQRILRFRRLFHFALQNPASNLADLAVEAGFADQPHMSRELQRLCQATPAEFMSQVSGRFVQDAP
jgi:AraC-like DNA-binding protein